MKIMENQKIYKLNSTTDDALVYKQYLTFINPLQKENKLTSQEIDVFAAILYYNNEYSDALEKYRSKLIFSSDTKKLIREMVGINSNSFNTIISKLKSKGVLDKDRNINPNFSIDPRNGLLIGIQFNINDSPGEIYQDQYYQDKFQEEDKIDENKYHESNGEPKPQRIYTRRERESIEGHEDSREDEIQGEEEHRSPYQEFLSSKRVQ